MNLVNVVIDGQKIAVESGTTVLDAAEKLGIKIPTLCFLKTLGPLSKCRVCLVEANGRLVTSCSFQVSEGMEIKTNTEKVIRARKTNIELILSAHNMDCEHCPRETTCELRELAEEYGADKDHFAGKKPNEKIDFSSPSFIRDNSKCILCGRCEAVCSKIQSVGVICNFNRGFDTRVGYAFDRPVTKTECVNCGQCVVNCPTGALVEKNDMGLVETLLRDPHKHVIAAMAPSVRVGLGEEFGLPIGTDVEKKMITALKKLGFKEVFDLNFSADLTITEEATEFIKRVKGRKKLPMFTSCCPGWVTFVSNFFPEFLSQVSTCKSPQQMFGAVCNTYYAEMRKIPPENLFVVTIIPCVTKKAERLRDGINATKPVDVDVALTVRELAKLLRKNKIDFAKLPDSEFDQVLGLSSGAGVIFGNTGGVMEAALRTLGDKVSGQDLKQVEYQLVRGLSGVKEATIDIAGTPVKVAVVSGLANARRVLTDIKEGTKYYDFVEVMACPSGCVNGGGMPIQPAAVKNQIEVAKLRAHGLYLNDQNKRYRKAHMNPAIIDLYKYIGEPGGKMAHKILHANQMPKPATKHPCE